MSHDTSAVPQGAVISVDPEAVLVDRRVLAFRPGCLAAVMESVGRLRHGLPRAAITLVEPLPAEQAVRFHFGKGEAAKSRDFSAQDLGVLLIAYCIGAHVPLPAKAAKAVSVTYSGVILDFVIAFAAPPAWQRPTNMPSRVKGEWNSRAP